MVGDTTYYSMNCHINLAKERIQLCSPAYSKRKTGEFWELAILKNSVFFNWPFWTFFLIFLLHFFENPSKVLGYQGWDKSLMITMISSQKSPTPNISAASVLVNGIPDIKWNDGFHNFLTIKNEKGHCASKRWHIKRSSRSFRLPSAVAFSRFFLVFILNPRSCEPNS